MIKTLSDLVLKAKAMVKLDVSISNQAYDALANDEDTTDPDVQQYIEDMDACIRYLEQHGIPRFEQYYHPPFDNPQTARETSLNEAEFYHAKTVETMLKTFICAGFAQGVPIENGMEFINENQIQ